MIPSSSTTAAAYDDFSGGALADCAAITPTFELRSYGGGIFLSGPTFADPTKTMAFVESPRLFRLIDSHTGWLKNLDISTMAGIHQQVTEGRARDMIMVCEALDTKLRSSNTAARIEARPEVRLLCLAGPSASARPRRAVCACSCSPRG